MDKVSVTKQKAGPFPLKQQLGFSLALTESRHEISNNVVCASSKNSDQPAHMRSLIRAFARCLNIICMLSY